MGIAINGSGTVTGISVGGLPDGIVDSGTLATNSVTSTELATNSVDSAELIDGAIDASHLASGVDTGMWKFISKQTASSSTTIDFVDLATGTYNKFRVEFYDVYCSADADMQIRLREAGGEAFTTTNYNGGAIGVAADIGDDTAYNDNQTDTSSSNLTPETISGGNAATRHSGFVEMGGFGTTSTRPVFWGMIAGANWETTSHGASFYFQENNADSDGYDGIRFLLSTGNYTAGSFSLYGLKES